ncbi:predicted protein [Uncinocarpus reesii 1704]|uniref:Uncharacterized protein n=1 Tax=Uncinocarpus reesii (strain UAMH 1704) TaxID=336963 RepID=C4JRA6_UNCRE|nr:uncharacterized protein UREG_04995 [Uncinocarpus reesii 1704]EEP80153.1 predicted protein [Uncinocarpus reesii 1704]
MSISVRDYAQSTEDSSISLPDIEAQACPTPQKRHRLMPSSSGHDASTADDGAQAGSSPSIKRRARRSNTARSYYPDGAAGQPGWRPGEEPGLDPSEPVLPPFRVQGEALLSESIHKRCDITVVDFSHEEIRVYQLDNDTLQGFLEREREPWVVCRWINVNGLSWDVVRLLATHKRLHKLAIEDLMHSIDRTKADWYSDHTFVLLEMQKLIKLKSAETSEESEAGSDTENEVPNKPGIRTSTASKAVSKRGTMGGVLKDALIDLLTPKIEKRRLRQYGSQNNLQPRAIRTLQRSRGGPNEDRIEFMERHAALASRGLGVAIEQVSIFLHADNTVTSFFEASGDDIEGPIVQRLRSPGTILRESCDASMVLQAIIDAITDLAIPVTRAYQDVIGELELEVLTDPDIHQSTTLYILTSEISVLRNAIQPMASVINSLRDHSSGLDIKKVASTPFLQPVRPPSRNSAHPDAEGVRMASAVAIRLVFEVIKKRDVSADMLQVPIRTKGYFGMNFPRFTGVNNHSDATVRLRDNDVPDARNDKAVVIEASAKTVDLEFKAASEG